MNESIWISKVTYNQEKNKKKEQSELQNSLAKMLLNRTYSYIFEPCVVQSNVNNTLAITSFNVESIIPTGIILRRFFIKVH